MFSVLEQLQLGFPLLVALSKQGNVHLHKVKKLLILVQNP